MNTRPDMGHYYYGEDTNYPPVTFCNGKYVICEKWEQVILERYGREWIDRNCVVNREKGR